MHFKRTLALGALALAATATTADAGKLERGVRTISPLFEIGTYAEFSAAVINPFADVTDITGSTIDGFYEADGDVGVAFKHDWTRRFSSAIIVDEPFGASIKYGPGSPLLSGIGANLTSLAVTSLYRYKFDRGFSIYAGSRSQYASFDVKLSDALTGLGGFTGYDASSGGDWGHGWVAGVAYEIPQLRLLVSATYHSEIEHEWDVRETVQAGVLPTSGTNLNIGTFENQTPQGVDIDFRFPVRKGTLVYGRYHWADWSETALILPTVGEVLSYNGDIHSIKLGLAQAIRPDWIVTGDITYEFESDEDTTPFRTSDGELVLGLASIHRFKNMTVTLGGQYKFLFDNDSDDDADPFPTGPARFIDNYSDQSALIVGMKVGWQLLPAPPSAPSLK